MGKDKNSFLGVLQPVTGLMITGDNAAYIYTGFQIYNEGSLIFPGVKIQENYKDNQDIVRMCKKRIRVPDQWYGDYLAAIGSARIGERSCKGIIKKYGVEKLTVAQLGGIECAKCHY